MTGTEKQIEWAEKIKRQVVDLAIDQAVQRVITDSVRRNEDDAACDARVADVTKRLKAAANTFEDANFWITARFANGSPCRETAAAINAIVRKMNEMRG